MSFKSAFTLALATVLWLGGCATQTPSDPPATTAPANQPEAPVVGAAVESPAVQAPPFKRLE